ncbi:hypothetical protein ACER0C_007288 [Sarotherodon galilaeus]
METVTGYETRRERERAIDMEEEERDKERGLETLYRSVVVIYVLTLTNSNEPWSSFNAGESSNKTKRETIFVMYDGVSGPHYEDKLPQLLYPLQHACVALRDLHSSGVADSPLLVLALSRGGRSGSYTRSTTGTEQEGKREKEPGTTTRDNIVTLERDKARTNSKTRETSKTRTDCERVFQGKSRKVDETRQGHKKPSREDKGKGEEKSATAFVKSQREWSVMRINNPNTMTDTSDGPDSTGQ